MDVVLVLAELVEFSARLFFRICFASFPIRRPSLFIPDHALESVLTVPCLSRPDPQNSSKVDSTKEVLG